MVTAGLGDVEFIVANTDQQALQNNAAPIKLQIGAQLTKGLGAGADPNVGRAAALEDTDKILEVLSGRRHGVRHDRASAAARAPGAAPVIASLANQLGALTVAVVTKPFKFEGRKRAAAGRSSACASSADAVDTMITIPNERLLTTVDKATSMSEAFAHGRRRAAPGDSGDLGSHPRAGPHQPRLRRRQDDHVAHGPGDHGHRHRARARIARASRRRRRSRARCSRTPTCTARAASSSTSPAVRTSRSPRSARRRRSSTSAAHEDANIIFGAVVDPKMEGKVKITVIATGFDRRYARPRRPRRRLPSRRRSI